MKKIVTCPNEGCLAKITYEESPESSRVLGVIGCSLIEGEVDCDQECARRMNIKRDAERK